MRLAFTLDIANQRTIYTMRGSAMPSRNVYVLKISNQLREDEIDIVKYHRRRHSTFILRSPPTTPLRDNDKIGWNVARVSPCMIIYLK